MKRRAPEGAGQVVGRGGPPHPDLKSGVDNRARGRCGAETFSKLGRCRVSGRELNILEIQMAFISKHKAQDSRRSLGPALEAANTCTGTSNYCQKLSFSLLKWV